MRFCLCSRFRPYDRARSLHSRCHRPSATRRDDARSRRSLANPTSRTPTLATAPTSQIITTRRPMASSTTAVATTGRDGPGRDSRGSRPAAGLAILASAGSVNGVWGRKRSASNTGRQYPVSRCRRPRAQADGADEREEQDHRHLDGQRGQQAHHGSSRSPRGSLLSGSSAGDAPADRPATRCAAFAPETIRAIRSSSGSVRSLASPPSNAATACSADPSKNVSTRCRNADRRAARRGVTGR